MIISLDNDKGLGKLKTFTIKSQHTIENTVIDIVVTTHGVTRVPDLSG